MAGFDDRTLIDTDRNRLPAVRKKLLETLYEGQNATELATDVPEQAPVPQQSSRSNRGVPDVQRRGEDQRTPSGNSGFGPSTFAQQMPGANMPFSPGIGGGAPQGPQSPQRPDMLGSSNMTGGALAQQQAAFAQAITAPQGAAGKFLASILPGSRGGPPAPMGGSPNWKGYTDNTANPGPYVPGQEFDTPPMPQFPGGGGVIDPGIPSGPPMTGDPSGGSYQSITSGGNNVSANVVRGSGHVPFGSAQTGPGSDRIAMANIGGRPVYKFTVKPGDRASNGNRAELVGSERFEAGKPYTFSWQTYIPTDFQNPQWGTFMQLHAPGSDPGNWGVHFTHADWSNPGRISLWTNGNHFTGGWSTPIERGKWLDFQMEVTFGGNGHVKLWYNGQKVVDTSANTGGAGWYVKQGLYRGDDGRAATIYQTPLKYGASQGTGGLGNPSGGGAAPGLPASGNKPPPASVLTTINNTPGMWSTSFQGNRKMYSITPNLYQSGQPISSGAFAQAGFDLIVNTRGNSAPKSHPGVQTYTIGLNDTETPTSAELQQAEQAAQVVADALRAGKRVLVHCYAGANRSGLVNALALIRLGYSRQQALDAVRAGRPGAVSNSAFERYILTGRV